MLISCLYVNNINPDPIPTDGLALVKLFNGFSWYLGVLLEDGIGIRSQLGQPFPALALQSDDLGPNWLQDAFFYLDVGVIVITDIYFILSRNWRSY